MGGVRADGLAVVPTWFEGAHHRVGVASLQRGLIAADDIARAVGAWFEDGWAQVAPSVDRPLAAIGAEHHRQLVGGLGDDRHRPRQLLPVAVQVRQQFHHRPAAGRRGGDGLDPGVVLGQPGLIPADEVPQLPVAADLAGPGVVDHHLARPRGLEDVGVAPVQCGEVLPDRISLARGAGLLARQLHGADEIRKPRHPNPHFLARPEPPWRRTTPLCGRWRDNCSRFPKYALAFSARPSAVAPAGWSRPGWQVRAELPLRPDSLIRSAPEALRPFENRA